MRPPGEPLPIAGANGQLVRPEPLQALLDDRMLDRETGLPQRVDDQAGRIAIGPGGQRKIARSWRLKWRRRSVPPPITKSLERPAAIVPLAALEIPDEPVKLFKLVAPGANQTVLERCGRQQSPDAVVEVLTRIVCPQVISQLLDSCSSISSTGQGRHHPDRQRRERGAGVRRIDALEWLEPHVEPLPGAVGAL